MRVGLDVTPAISGLTGVARHTRVLCEQLRAAGVEVRAFGIGRGPGHPPAGTRRISMPLRIVQRTWDLPVPRIIDPWTVERICGPVDLAHSIDLVPPPTRAPVVATMHDLAALDAPELHPPGVVTQARRRLAALDRVDAIIANSYATADALARRGISEDRISVVHLAPHPLPAGDGTELPVAGSYVLAVGELTARKDYPTMFEAFARSGLKHSLVVVGPSGFGAEVVRAAAVASGLGPRLILAGAVDDQILGALYAQAVGYLLTSRQEGFGIPLVEAMGRGVPIIASDLEAVREVTAGAAVLAAPGDVSGFAGALRLLDDPVERDRLRVAGLARAADFSWERTTAETIAIYQRLTGSG